MIGSFAAFAFSELGVQFEFVGRFAFSSVFTTIIIVSWHIWKWFSSFCTDSCFFLSIVASFEAVSWLTILSGHFILLANFISDVSRVSSFFGTLSSFVLEVIGVHAFCCGFRWLVNLCIPGVIFFGHWLWLCTYFLVNPHFISCWLRCLLWNSAWLFWLWGMGNDLSFNTYWSSYSNAFWWTLLDHRACSWAFVIISVGHTSCFCLYLCLGFSVSKLLCCIGLSDWQKLL